MGGLVGFKDVVMVVVVVVVVVYATFCTVACQVIR